MLRRHLSLMLLLGLCLAAFAGCAEATATVSPGHIPPAKPGMARVWFFRGQLTPQFGAVAAFDPGIYANGAPVATIPPGTTFYRDFAPGSYRFTVWPQSLGLPTPQATTLQLGPDTQYYLQVDWIQSWTQGYPEAGFGFGYNTFGILQMNPQVAQAYIPTLAYLGER